MEDVHEEAVCEFAAQRVVAQRNGGVLVVDSHPDKEDRQGPAIDLLAHDALGPIAVEHTAIEAYENQLHDNRRIAEVFTGFAERFGHSLASPGTYTLAIHTRGGHLFPRRDQSEALDGLEHWVRAQRLPEPEIPPKAPNHVVGRPPVVPVPVTLFRMRCDPSDDSSLRIALLRLEDHEEERVVRIARALTTKLAKLEAARPKGGVTVLALESRDFVMSNPVVIAQAVFGVAGERPLLPDVIVHVDTTAGLGHWIDYWVKIGNWWSDAAQGI